MSVSGPFIARPIATALLTLAVTLGGLLGYWWLPISSLPQVDFPTIQITTQLPGANPETMGNLVTAPLERQLGQIPALTSMTSTSSYGISQITLQFSLNRDIDAAAQDVQAAINAAGSTLPRTLPYPPTYAKLNPADAPIITLALTSETVPLRALSDLADTLMAQRLASVSGVGHVSVQGGIKPAVRIQADIARLASYGLSMADLRSAIASANQSGPKGSLDGKYQFYTISSNDQITNAEAYKAVIVAYRNNAPVLLQDVAQVVDGLENSKVGGWFQDAPAVVLDVHRQPGANVIETVQRIKAELPRIERAMPTGVKLTVVSDRTGTIRASVRDVQFTLVLSVALVVLVVLLFLRTIRATIIAGITLPVSLIATFGVMWFCDFSLNNLSLMALTVATGFVVDDAIVMIENIVRHMENGERPMQAALKGAREIGFTVISLTLSLIAVFIPLLFMSGLVGRMFREFALTLTIAVVVSAIVSLTLTPMMCSRLLRHLGEGRPGWIARFFNGAMDLVVRGYHRSLLWVLRHERATLLVTLATLLMTIGLYLVVPEGLSAAAGHRARDRRDGGRPRGLVRGDGAAAERHRRQDPQGRRRGGRRLRGGRKRAQPHAQHRAPEDHAEIPHPAHRPRLPDHRAPAGRRRRRAGHDGLLPAGAGRADLDAHEPGAVPVHAGGRQHGGGLALVGTPGREAARRARAARGGLRGAGRGPARLRQGRPRHRRTPRRVDAGRQRRAQRRLRPAPDLHHLRPGQPVPRGAGGDGPVPDRPGGAVARVRAVQHRRPGPAQLGGDRGAAHRAPRHPAPGPVPGGDDQLQPGTRRLAQRRRRCDRRGGARDRDAERACRASSRATPWSSRARLPPSPG